MLPIRKRIKKTSRHYSLRKKLNGLKNTSNDQKIYVGVEETKQRNDHLDIITLFPNKA